MSIGLKYKNTEDVFTEKEINNIPFLIFNNLENTGIIKQAFTTRIGGVSKGDCATMNISLFRGDSKEAVEENKRRLSKAIGIDKDTFTYTHQEHTTNIKVVKEEDRGAVFEDTDGMITNVANICLVTFYADCVPLYFVDPINKAIGLSHSGWKGTVSKMGLRTVMMMNQEFGTDPKELLVGIGPSICQECYEVSDDVTGEIHSAIPNYNNEDLFYLKDNGKYQLNLWRANQLILEEAGVPAKNIATTNVCTCCNPDILFSHRASKGKRGNLTAMLSLK
ncbi:MAG: peptidoglycan editing factor PgeF [Suipraeoptans sp.]